jgi:2-polyprenyl-3-methyl-5-hydroxy-6-metoxy-1,4-benzoquinol methylase
MSEEHINKTLAQTYVWHGEKCFFVSTINRRSSSLLSGIYAETLAWEWIQETKQCGRLIGQDEHCQNSIFAHQAMVKRLFDTGKPNEV